MLRQFELAEMVRAYDPHADEALINSAYVFAMQRHGGQLRDSGDPYFSHPVEVAGLLAAMHLDTASIVTALLHDTVEDTEATLDEIETLFGPEVAQLVDGVTKLSRIQLKSKESKEAENFRKLVLATSKDVRVLLVKLADRLHNMRTLHFVKREDRRRRIARETMDIYAPLAERIGIQAWAEELNDLAFAQLEPEGWRTIVDSLALFRDRGAAQIDQILAELRGRLAEAGIEAEVSGREKRPFSIWRKMQSKAVKFDQVTDLMAFRIVTGSVADCYQALGIVHSNYPMLPGRFKDYISLPKPNGYRSVHTGVIGPGRVLTEIQIRTAEMHEAAERGTAAHWQYKQDGVPDGASYGWLNRLVQILEDAAGAEEFLEHTKLEMHQDQIFVFTPKGELMVLPRDATTVDFAYHVHSDIGDACTGARINGRLIPLNTKIQTGDQVEIITGKSREPSPEWLRFVVTAKAKARIRRFTRQQQRDQYAALGREMLRRLFAEHGEELRDKALRPAFEAFNLKTPEDLAVSIGEGRHTETDLARLFFPQGADPSIADDKVISIAEARRGRPRAPQPLALKGLIPGMAMHFARCCHPLPGDRIIGIVTTGKGITVHTAECATLESFSHTPERWIDVDWDAPGTAESHNARIRLTTSNTPGSLAKLSTIIAQNKGNISNLKFTQRTTDFVDMQIDISVKDVDHLNSIIAALRAQPMISSVDRARM